MGSPRHVPPPLFNGPEREEEARNNGFDALSIKNSEALLRQVERYGGKSFLATDETALEKIRQRLDMLYASMVEVKIHTAEQHIYRLPLVAAVLLFSLAVAARLVLWKFYRVV